MKIFSCLMFSLAMSLASSAPAHADAAGDAVLAQMDAAMNKAKTLKWEYAIVNKESPAKAESTAIMKLSRKGAKQFAEFTAPADMKGTKFLILSPTQMYVYLPAFGKVRRIASHSTDTGFLGLSLSQDDIATLAYSPQYTAAVTAQDAGTWKLTLTAKAGQDTSYAKIAVTVTKDKKVPTELQYFNAQGKNVKSETRSGYSCEGDVCTASELKMTDNVKGSWTKFTAKSRQVNSEISDDVFSQRSLGE